MKCTRRLKKLKFPRLRKLKNIWSIDREVDLVCMHGLDVENELARILTEEIIKEVEINGIVMKLISPWGMQ